MCSGFPSSCFISLTCNVWMSYCWGSFRVLLDGIYIMANELVLFSTQTHCPFLLSYDLERKKDKSFSTLSDIFFFSTTWAQTLYLQWKGNLPLNTGEACIPKPSGFAFNMLLQQRLTLHTKFAVIKAHKKLASWCSWAYSCWIRIWGEFCRHQSPDPRKQRSPQKCCVSTARAARCSSLSPGPVAFAPVQSGSPTSVWEAPELLWKSGPSFLNRPSRVAIALVSVDYCMGHTSREEFLLHCRVGSGTGALLLPAVCRGKFGNKHTLQRGIPPEHLSS